MEVVQKGSIKNIAVSMEDRQGGRKHITRLVHVESFALNPGRGFDTGSPLLSKPSGQAHITVAVRVCQNRQVWKHTPGNVYRGGARFEMTWSSSLHSARMLQPAAQRSWAACCSANSRRIAASPSCRGRSRRARSCSSRETCCRCALHMCLISPCLCAQRWRLLCGVSCMHAVSGAECRCVGYMLCRSCPDS